MSHFHPTPAQLVFSLPLFISSAILEFSSVRCLISLSYLAHTLGEFKGSTMTFEYFRVWGLEYFSEWGGVYSKIDGKLQFITS